MEPGQRICFIPNSFKANVVLNEYTNQSSDIDLNGCDSQSFYKSDELTLQALSRNAIVDLSRS